MALVVLAQLPTCEGGDCPKIVRDTDHPGMVGIRGAIAPTATEEHVSWMTEEQFGVLAGQLRL